MAWNSTLFGLLWIGLGVVILVREVRIFLYLRSTTGGTAVKIRSVLFVLVGVALIVAGAVVLAGYYRNH